MNPIQTYRSNWVSYNGRIERRERARRWWMEQNQLSDEEWTVYAREKRVHKLKALWHFHDRFLRACFGVFWLSITIIISLKAFFPSLDWGPLLGYIGAGVGIVFGIIIWCIVLIWSFVETP